MQIQLIRSATLRVKIEGTTFLIDPWFAGKGEGNSYSGDARSPLVDLPMSVEAIMENVDAIIISHLHSDHWDVTAQNAIRRDMPIICEKRYADQIRSQGFVNIQPITCHSTFGRVDIRVTYGRHGPPEILEKMGSVTGFVFRTTNEPSLYWAGDTILCDDVRRIITDVDPDVIVVHACGAVWDEISPLVMDFEMTVETLSLSDHAVVIATHLDAVDHATVTRSELKRVRRTNLVARERLRIPDDGEILTFET